MKRIWVLAVIVVLVLVHGVAFGQPLDRSTINRWADSMEEIERWGEAQADLYGDDDDFDDSDLYESFARAARDNAEIRRIIGRHGFSSGDQWAQLGSRIMHAYGSMQMGDHAPELQQEMRRQMDEIDRLPYLTPEQKQMMRQEIQRSMGMMEDFHDAPPEDVAAVRANRGRLDRLFEDD